MLLGELKGTCFCSQQCWSLSEVCAVSFSSFAPRHLQSGESETSVSASSPLFLLCVPLLQFSYKLLRFCVAQDFILNSESVQFETCRLLNWGLQTARDWFCVWNQTLASRAFEREEFSNICVKDHVCAKQKVHFLEKLEFCMPVSGWEKTASEFKFETFARWVWVPVHDGNELFRRDSSPGLQVVVVGKVLVVPCCTSYSLTVLKCCALFLIQNIMSLTSRNWVLLCFNPLVRSNEEARWAAQHVINGTIKGPFHLWACPWLLQGQEELTALSLQGEKPVSWQALQTDSTWRFSMCFYCSGVFSCVIIKTIYCTMKLTTMPEMKGKNQQGSVSQGNNIPFPETE